MLKFIIFCASIGSLYKIYSYNSFLFFNNRPTNCPSSREGACASHSGSALALQLQLQYSYPPSSFSYEQCRKCMQLTIWTDWFDIRATTWSDFEPRLIENHRRNSVSDRFLRLSWTTRRNWNSRQNCISIIKNILIRVCSPARQLEWF